MRSNSFTSISLMSESKIYFEASLVYIFVKNRQIERGRHHRQIYQKGPLDRNFKTVRLFPSKATINV